MQYLMLGRCADVGPRCTKGWLGVQHFSAAGGQVSETLVHLAGMLQQTLVHQVGKVLEMLTHFAKMVHQILAHLASSCTKVLCRMAEVHERLQHNAAKCARMQ